MAGLGLATLSLEASGAEVPSARWRLSLGRAGLATTFGQTIALQLLAYRLGHATDTDPDRPLHLKDDHSRFRASRLLTRRSLVGIGA